MMPRQPRRANRVCCYSRAVRCDRADLRPALHDIDPGEIGEAVLADQPDGLLDRVLVAVDIPQQPAVGIGGRQPA